jgi:DNA polymerase
MIFYHFRVFKYDWVLSLYDSDKRKFYGIVNNFDNIYKFFDMFKDEIWCGYNSRVVEQYLLKATLCRFNPFYVLSYINKGNQGFKYSYKFNKFPVINYDIIQGIDKPLQMVEGFMGSQIYDSASSDKKLSEDELEKERKICKKELINIVNIFNEQLSQFNAMKTLVKQFDLPLDCIGKTEAQLTSRILECEATKRDDEFDFIIEPYNKINKYTEVFQFYKDMQGKHIQNFYKQKIECDVCGVKHKFGWGGVHAARVKYIFTPKLHKRCFHIDVTSYYPSYLIAHNKITRSAKHPERYVWAYNHQIMLKRSGKKKERLPFKKMLNALSGAMKDKFNDAYDPCMNNTMVVNCQLSTLMLLEMLEEIESFELIQSNTDGLIIAIDDSDETYNLMLNICHKWEDICSTDKARIALDFDEIEWLCQKDVNNFIFQFKGSDKIEQKGTYLKKLSEIDNQLPIINKSLYEYFVNDTPLEDTIHNCDNLQDFQLIRNISEKFSYIQHGNDKLSERCIRIFASKRESDGGLFKFSIQDEKLIKLEGTPLNCFINNDNVSSMRCPWFLDKDWYLQMAYDRLNSFIDN